MLVVAVVLAAVAIASASVSDLVILLVMGKCQDEFFV